MAARSRGGGGGGATTGIGTTGMMPSQQQQQQQQHSITTTAASTASSNSSSSSADAPPSSSPLFPPNNNNNNILKLLKVTILLSLIIYLIDFSFNDIPISKTITKTKTTTTTKSPITIEGTGTTTTTSIHHKEGGGGVAAAAASSPDGDNDDDDSKKKKKKTMDVVDEEILVGDSNITTTAAADAANTNSIVEKGKKILFLNVTDGSTLLQHETTRGEKHTSTSTSSTSSSTITIDVLIIGSKHNLNQVQVQRETWASHPAIRNFILSTEYDDEDSECTSIVDEKKEEHEEKFSSFLENFVSPCYTTQFWKSLSNNANNKLTTSFTQGYFGSKKSFGWICVQRRFITSLTKLISLYSDSASAAADSASAGGSAAAAHTDDDAEEEEEEIGEKNVLPDYLILCDDDTYINIDHIIQNMSMDNPTGGSSTTTINDDDEDDDPTIENLEKEEEEEEEEEATFHHDEVEGRKKEGSNTITTTTATTPDTPTVTTGCRIRAGNEDLGLTWTFPFGGYGTFFSRGSLRRLIRPLHCNKHDYDDDNDDVVVSPTSPSEDDNLFERGTCQKLVGKKTSNDYPMSATLGEEKYFDNGDSLNEVLYKYSRNVNRFCLHSDWFVGYMSNFYNISIHTKPGEGVSWYDYGNKYMDVSESRLHTLQDSEWSHGTFGGQCKYGETTQCDPGVSTICHYMNIEKFEKVHSEVQKQKQQQHARF